MTRAISSAMACMALTAALLAAPSAHADDQRPPVDESTDGPESLGTAQQQSASAASSAKIVLSTTKLIVPEERTAVYSVQLAAAPTHTVTVTLSRNATGDSNITFDTDPKMAGDQSTLTFSTTNWSAARTVTVAAANDTDKAYGTATITHTAASTDTNYQGKTSTLAASEGDNDVCQGTAAVGNVNTGGLIGDCNTLLAAEEMLAGSLTRLNWATTTAMSSWTGLTVTNSRVTQVDLWYQSLNGSIPNTLGHLSGLTFLELGRNSLRGPIPPEIGNLRNLTYLSLAWNWNLSGSIPAEIGNLSNLEQLWLYYTGLNGSIPPQLGNLTNLKRLVIYWSQLSGPIPPQLGNLTNLEWLRLQGNSLNGSIPPEIGNLTKLEWLNIRSNQLTGTIPAQLGNLTNLKWLYLHSNQLTGSIPAQLGNLTNLQTLYLNGNSLTGSIPAQLGNLTNLQTLNLQSNSLTGSIPAQLGNLTNLINLWLANNSLTGSIPPELGNLTNLRQLMLNANAGQDKTTAPGLSGSIPKELGNLKNLEDIRLLHNSLTGSIPKELAGLTSVTTIDLANNLLSGSIPVELTSLPKILQLDLRYNNLSGCYPSFYSGKTSFRQSYLLHAKFNKQLSNKSLPVCQGLNLSVCTGLSYSVCKNEERTESEVSVPEGLTPSNHSYSIRVSFPANSNKDPTAAITVTLVLTGDSDVSADKTSLSFATGNYSTYQHITLTAAEDNDVNNGTVTITHTSSSTDTDYDGLTASLSVIEADNDTGLVASGVSENKATLTIVNHTGDWWLKRTTPADTSSTACKAKDTADTDGDTESLSGLSPGTSYTYKAYSDSTCTTEIASETFTTMTPASALYATNITADSATLTLANRTGNWWLSRTTPADTTCKSKGTTYTEDLTGLTPSTNYTYAAYSDASCTTEITDASFTTSAQAAKALRATGITHNRATLTLANHSGDWWLSRTIPADTTCKSKGTTYTESLASLTPSTDYTYAAYSNSNCSTEIADVSFQTTAKLPALTVSSITVSSAKLTLTNHSSSWYLQRITPSDTTCKSKGTTYTEDLASLDHSTEYIYGAYSDASCTTEIASETFSTLSPTLTASNVAHNRATLTLVNPVGDWWLKRTTPPDTSNTACKSKGTTYTEDLTGLTASTSYTYKAYSDSTCSTELSSLTFTTEAAPYVPPPIGGAPTGGGGEEKVGSCEVFDDIADSIFCDAIAALARLGITLGCDADGTSFCPTQPVTRAQAATFLARALKLPVPETRRAFRDTADSYHRDSIAAIARAGITVGCQPAKRLFCPNEPVKRSQMATLLTRALELPIPMMTDVFGDTVNNYHRDSIAAIAVAGITVGCNRDRTLFCPDEPVKRSQMAAFLARAFDLL